MYGMLTFHHEGMAIIMDFVEERCGSLVECLTRDRRVGGPSLTRGHCVLEQDTLSSA